MRFKVVPLRAIACSAVLAALLTTTGCGEPEPGSGVHAEGAPTTSVDGSAVDDADGGDEVPGELGEDIDAIIEGLSDDEVACIEAANSPAEAVATCVSRALLAEQVLGVIADSWLVAEAPSSEMELLRTCLIQAIEALDDEQIDELAAMEESAMVEFGEQLGSC